MSEVIPNLGEDNTYNEKLYEGLVAAPKYSAWEAAQAIKEDIKAEAPVESLKYLRDITWSNNVNPGKLMSQEEWRQSDYYLEGLNYDQIKNGDGLIGQNTAEIIYKRHKASLERDEIITNSSQTYGAKALYMGAAVAGYFSDNLNIAFTVGSVGVGNLIRAWGMGGKVFSAAANPIARASARTALEMGIAVAETGLALAPDKAINYASKKETGIEVNPLESMIDYLKETGLAAPVYLFLKGVGASVVGTYKGGKYVYGKVKEAYRPVTPETHAIALDTTLAQMASGKVVDVEPVLKAGMADMKEGQSGAIGDMLIENKAALQATRAAEIDVIEKLEKELADSSTLDSETLGLKQQELAEAKDRLLEITEAMEQNETITTLQAQDGEPITLEKLEEIKERNASYKSDTAYDQMDGEIYHKDVMNAEAINKNPDMSLIDNKLKELESKGKLSPEALEVINATNKALQDSEVIEDALTQIVDCLVENGL